MNSTRSRQITSWMLVAGALALGLGLAGFTEVGSQVQAAAQPAVEAAAAQEQPVAGARVALPSFADLVEKALPAVVTIEASTIERGRAGGMRPHGTDPFEFFFGPRRQQPEGRQEGEEEFRSDSGGSGFLISADGLVVTNYHVIEGASKIRVHLADRDYEAEVRGTDPATDLALLKIDAGKGLPYLRLGDSDRLRAGDWIVVIGNPLRLAQTVTVGVVSGKGRAIGISADRSLENFIQTDAAINRGNSGGPLVNLAGEVVGIASAMNWGAQNVGFAVPVNTLRGALDQLLEKGRVSRGYLGISIETVDHERAEAFGLEGAGGALVVRVEPDTPAAEAGLEHGDIVLKVDGRPVGENRDLIDYVSAKAPGESVSLQVWRDGKTFEKRLKLAERPGAGGEAEESEEGAESGIEWLGLEYQDLTPGLRSMHDIPQEADGVWINDVHAASPLVDEGVQPGDIITEVNGRPVKGVAEFERAVEAVAPGSYLRLYLQRYDPRGQQQPVSFFAFLRVPR